MAAPRSRVSDQLVRGPRIDMQTMADLKAGGIRGIVNLCLENDDDAGPADRLGLKALRIPIADNTAPTHEQATQCLDFVSQVGSAYVHCLEGVGRTGVMCACYRMLVEGWPAERAIAEAKDFGMRIPAQWDFIQWYYDHVVLPARSNAASAAHEVMAARRETATKARVNFGDRIDWAAEARAQARDGISAEQVEHIRTFVEQVDSARHPNSVVDCGCNIGRFVSAFRGYSIDYVGIDQSEEALAIARAKYPEARFERSMLWDDWPALIGAPVDAAICNAVLQHNTLDEKRRILPRIAAAVRPGGVFGMQESTVPVATETQLRQGDWVALVEGFGFELIKMWHPNVEHGILDGYLFRRVV